MFYINTENVRSAVTLFSSGEQTVNNLSHQVDDVCHSIHGLSGMDDVIPTLEYLRNQMRQEADKLGQLFESGNRIAREYERAEEDILNNQEGVGMTFEGGARLQDFSGQTDGAAPSNKIDYGTLEELSGLFF
jgi:hypothetical protein